MKLTQRQRDAIDRIYWSQNWSIPRFVEDASVLGRLVATGVVERYENSTQSRGERRITSMEYRVTDFGLTLREQPE